MTLWCRTERTSAGFDERPCKLNPTLFLWFKGWRLHRRRRDADAAGRTGAGQRGNRLSHAVNQLRDMNEAAKQLRAMFEGTKARSMFSGITGSLFPLFTDGPTGTIAVEVTPTKRNKVVVVEFESTEPVRQAYGSFGEFLKDAIRANKDDDRLIKT